MYWAWVVNRANQEDNEAINMKNDKGAEERIASVDPARTSDGRMNIFFCIDNKYDLPAYIALFSLLHNYRGNKKIDIYLLTSDGIDEKYVSLIKSLEGKYPFLSITIQCIQNCFKDVPIKLPHVTTATMYRLLIPRIARELNIDKCIYLDSDMVVEGDISELFDVDLDGFCIGGVKDPCPCNTTPELRELLEVSDLRDYINAGVLLFNVREIERNGLSEKLEVAGHRTDYPSNDQDAINSVFHNRIKLLSLRFNVIAPFLYDRRIINESKYRNGDLIEARKNPLIIHYIGSRKPWASQGTPLARIWWKYVRMQDKDIQAAYIKPFIEKSRLPLQDRIKDTIRTITLRLKVYEVVTNVYHKICIRQSQNN